LPLLTLRYLTFSISIIGDMN